MAQYKTFLTSPIKVPDLVLASGGTAAAFVAFHSFYHYVLLRDRTFTSLAGWVLYLLVPVALCVSLFFSLRLERSYKLAAIFSLAVALISACGEEWALMSKEKAEPPYWGIRANSEQEQSILKIARQAGVDFDTRKRPAVVTAMRSQGVDAVPFVGATFMEKLPDGSYHSKLNVNHAELIPLGGISDKLTIACDETGSFTSYKSDERGFNNPRGIWSLRRVEIAALGQSFIQGFCASAGKDFVDLVRKHYPSTLNLGFSGEGPLMQLGAINEYLTSLRPKIVLWFYIEDIDLGDLQNERKSLLARRYMEDHFKQGLISRQSDIDQALTSYSETEVLRGKATLVQEPPENNWKEKEIVDFIEFKHVRQKLRLIYGEKLDVLSPLDNANIKLFGDILAQANRRVGQWGGKLHLVYLPSWKRFGSRSPLPDQERALIYAAAHASNVPIIDALPGFYAQKDPLSLFPFRVFGHYNEAGHQVVADEVLKAIAASKTGHLTGSRSN